MAASNHHVPVNRSSHTSSWCLGESCRRSRSKAKGRGGRCLCRSRAETRPGSSLACRFFASAVLPGAACGRGLPVPSLQRG